MGLETGRIRSNMIQIYKLVNGLDEASWLKPALVIHHRIYP